MAFVNSSFVTCCGATALTGPRRDSSSTARRMTPTKSSSVIQFMYWLPLPSFPPTPSLNGVSIFCKAPPSPLNTTPMRRCTTRMPAWLA